DARVVVKILKSLFARFGTPRAIISDRGTHFCNDQFTKVMLKYGVTQRLATMYHPKTSGQVEVLNRGLKRILKRTVGENCASWSDKLDDALWAFRTTFKTPIGCTPYKLVYGKTAGDHRKVQMNELNELRDQAYENSLIYKEKTKRIHDSKIKNRVFNVGHRVLLFNSRLKIFSGKLKTRWTGPFIVAQVFPYGTVELSQTDGPNFKVNSHRLKHYFGGDMPPVDVPDLKLSPWTTKFGDRISPDYEASRARGVIHKTSVSRPQLISTQMKDKVVKNNSEVKSKKKELEDHHKISSISNKTKSIVQLILFIVDSGCTKHITGNLKLLCNFVEKYLGIIHFENDQLAPIIDYRDLIQGNIMINRVCYVEGLNHNLFSVSQFCDADLEVAFRKSTCFVRDLQGNDLLTGNRGSDLYTISLQETTSSTPICFMAKASPTQAWLWHRRLSHLNFDYINLLSKKDIVIGLPKLKYVKDQLCSSCEVSKAKRSSFKTKVVPSSKGWLNLLHMDLCGPMRVESINGKKYILVIVDDYSRYTWTLFLRSKDETPEVLKDFLKMIQRNLQAQVITVRTDRGTEFLNKTLHAYFKEEGIEHQTSTPRTPEQNGIVER
ncbi:retrovirus-related pol polyprotein from transposon TNT 1-94, partial [Tanacetum coccineum]